MDLDTGAPTDELHADTLAWFKSLGVSYKLLTEVIAAGPCPKVRIRTRDFQKNFSKKRKFISQVLAAIDDGIKRANNHATSNAQKIQKFAILPHDFSIHTGELGPTLKVKRSFVSQKYDDVISAFYD